MTREEAVEIVKKLYNNSLFLKKDKEAMLTLIPELDENDEERIREVLCDIVRDMPYMETELRAHGLTVEKTLTYLENQNHDGKKWITPAELNRLETLRYESGFNDGVRSENEKQKEQKPIKMEVYEVGKGTTVCGQDYKCKKDYKVGNCWYIKDAIYHCGRDGYLTDQNGVSWSCTPEWFNEYIQSNTEWAEEEKTRFVSRQFLQCKLSFDEFKEGEHYWLEYIGDDMYVGRSDNILNQKFHITPRQLYTLFSQKLEEVQGPPQEEKQVSLNYEPPFDENPSDNEIIEALIKHLKEQDGFLTAIDCVSTKAILRWLEKQKEQKPVHTAKEMWKEMRLEVYAQASGNRHEPNYSDDSTKMFSLCDIDEIFEKIGNSTVGSQPAEWSEEDERIIDTIVSALGQYIDYKAISGTGSGYATPRYSKEIDWLKFLSERFNPQPKQEWSKEEMKVLDSIIDDYEKAAKSFCGYDGKIGLLKAIRDGEYNLSKHAEWNGATMNGEPIPTENHSVDIPLAEWSEEDEKLLDFWLDVIDRNDWRMDENFCKASREFINKLKSLCPSWKPNEQEKGALRTAIHVLTEERNFPKAAGHLQEILDAFDGKESRKDWKPSKEQLEALGIAMDRNDSIGYNLRQLYEQLKKLI